MPEIHQSLRSFDEWRKFTSRLGDRTELIDRILADVARHGYVEPFTETRRQPFEIEISRKNLRESISSHQLNARKRALLLQTWIELTRRKMVGNPKLKILAAEAITRAASILRGRYPLFLGSEFLPGEAEQAEFFPVPHVDLQKTPFTDNTFDVFFSGDVFEHIPDLDKALGEIHRVLKPGGLLISSFPFHPAREETLVKAVLTEGGEIEHLTEPEYHGNPVDPEGGSLVYSVPGWDILDKLEKLGFDEAEFKFIASSHYGVAVQNSVGALTLVARKAGGAVDDSVPKANYFIRDPLPRKLVTALGLPRSGTTLLTSLFAVHSEFEAVYEPWNAGQLAGEEEAKLLNFLPAATSGDIQGKVLFVKETAAKASYIRCINELMRTTPIVIDKHLLVIIRRPDQTYLSEITRRKEWWDSDVEVSQQSFDSWCRKSKPSLAQFIRMLNAKPATVLALEALADEPERMLRILNHRIGEAFEPQQLNYQESLDRKLVRGDKNIGESPSAIDPKLATSRDKLQSKVRKFAKRSEFGDWFGAFEEFHDAALANGGWMTGPQISRKLKEKLLG